MANFPITIYEATKACVMAMNDYFTIEDVKKAVDLFLDHDCNRQTIRYAVHRVKYEGIIIKVGSVPTNSGYPATIFKKISNS